MSKLWRLASRNLARNKRRNLATGMAITFGFAGIVIIAGFVLRVDHYLQVASIYLQHVGHVSIYNEGGFDGFSVKPKKFGLTPEHQAVIKEVLEADSRVEYFGRHLGGTGLAGNGCKAQPFIGFGMDPVLDQRAREHPQVLEWTPELARVRVGKPLANYPDLPGAVLISTGLARLLGKTKVHEQTIADPPNTRIQDCSAADIKERIAEDANIQLAAGTYAGSFGATDAEIVGIISTGATDLENAALFTSVDTLQQLFETDVVTRFEVILKSAADTADFASDVEDALATKGLDIDVFPYDDARANMQYVGTVSFLRVMNAFIAVVALVVIVLSILNSMTMTIIERTREIGTFRSLGFTRSQVIWMFIYEALTLAALAFVVGLLVAFASAWAINHSGIRYFPPGVPEPILLVVKPSLTWCLAAAAEITLLALVATWWAARQRAHRNIAEILVATAR